jgi:sodium pump decarboxylase gamma subunit
MFLATNWNAVWSMTGMGIGIVFVILLLLVLVLQIFTLLAMRKGHPGTPAAHASASPKAAEAPAKAPFHGEDEETAAAIAAAMYLFSEEAHDVESGVITIVHNDHSTWHHFR